VGRCLQGLSVSIPGGDSPPPKWDPPLSPVTTNCQCATPSIAHTHQPGHPIKNSLRDPP
jgi:hypothetical protein